MLITVPDTLLVPPTLTCDLRQCPFSVSTLFQKNCRWIHVYNRTSNTVPAGVGGQVATCDDCGPCGLQTVLDVELTVGEYWCVATNDHPFVCLFSRDNTRTLTHVASMCIAYLPPLFDFTQTTSRRVVMDGFASGFGSYTLTVSCAPPVTYIGSMSCGQNYTGDTTGAVRCRPCMIPLPSFSFFFQQHTPCTDTHAVIVAVLHGIACNASTDIQSVS